MGYSMEELLPERNGQKHIFQRIFERVYHCFRVYEKQSFTKCISTEISHPKKFLSQKKYVYTSNSFCRKIISGICKSSFCPTHTSDKCLFLYSSAEEKNLLYSLRNVYILNLKILQQKESGTRLKC